jgi:DNA-binding NarL/FixJ family response regulator
MLGNAQAKTNNRSTGKKALPQNINFDILFLAADEGLIELEEAANILLSAAAGLGHKSGVYTQVQLDRKIRNENNRLPETDECAVPSETAEYLLERQLDDLLDVSGLTTFEEIIFRLRFTGMTMKDIAGELGLDPLRTVLALKTARRKVRTAYEEGKYAGWYEVYLSEVNRTRKR